MKGRSVVGVVFVLFLATFVFISSVGLFGRSSLFSSLYYRETTSAQEQNRGDFNADFKVDVFDLGFFATCYNNSIGLFPEFLPCDFNNDTIVDIFDLGVFASVYGTTYTPGAGGNSALVTINFEINAGQVVPPTTSQSVGNAVVTIDPTVNTLTYRLTYDGNLLLGQETGAHIHGPASVGANAAIAHNLPLGTFKTGSWQYPENLEADLLAGNYYVLIHSAVFTDGEIRGQITKNPVPTPLPTVAPLPPANPSPTLLANSGGQPADPTPTFDGVIPTEPAAEQQGGNFPYGRYPENCVYPGVPVSFQGWWSKNPEAEVHEQTHIHYDYCMPTARRVSGNPFTVTGSPKLPVKFVNYNSTQPWDTSSSWYRAQWQGDTYEQIDLSFPRCQNTEDEMKACAFELVTSVDTGKCGGGQNELRLTPNTKYEDGRHFLSTNSQIPCGDGGSYRGNTGFWARYWVEPCGEYLRAYIDYAKHLSVTNNEVIATVSGVVPLEIRHTGGCGGEKSSVLTLDAKQHGVLVGTDLYNEPGLKEWTYQWDTRGLSDGIHSLNIVTTEKSSFTYSSVIRVLFNVQN